MIDTHCHLNLDPLWEKRDDYLAQAKQAGVTRFIIPGVNIDSSKQAIEVAKTGDHCFAAVGIHPDEAVNLSGHEFAYTLTQLENLIDAERVVAIGECGLDLYQVSAEDKHHVLTRQLELLQAQIGMAQTHDLPLCFHVREAQDEIISLLETNPVKGVLHCFSGERNYLRQALDLGLYISFAGNLTFANAQELRDLLMYVPVDRLLLETDAPFLNPDRGQFPNHPAQIVKTYEAVAKLKDLSSEELADQIDKNANELFELNKLTN